MGGPTDRDPAYAEPDEREGGGLENPLAPRSDASLPARPAPRQPPRSHATYSAVFGNCERSGGWSAPDRLSIECWFGEVKLDFREAEIASDGVVEVKANAIFGQVTLRVPRGTEIDLEGVSAVFGGVDSKRIEEGKLGRLARQWLTGDREDDYEEEEQADSDEEPMVLRVIGNAVFGQVTVEVG